MKEFLLITLPILILSIAISFGITILFRIKEKKYKERLARKLYEEAIRKEQENERK